MNSSQKKRAREQIKLLLSFSGATRKPKKKLPRQVPPDLIAAKYARELKGYLDIADELVRKELEPLIKYRLDASKSDKIQDAFDKIENQFFDKLVPRKKMETYARMIADDTNRHARAQLGRQIVAAFGVDVSREPNLVDQITGFVGENVSLIRSLPSTYFDDIEKLVTRSVSKGDRWESISQDMQDRLGVSKKRADLIARDQTGKLFGAIEQARQEELGITRYIWRTVNDVRVREEHAEREGQSFSWDDPPEDGHPGEAINCFPGDVVLKPSARIDRLYRRRFSGELTKLVTGDGESVSCTPNHPILTRRGLVAAKNLEIGDQIVKVKNQVFDVFVENPNDIESDFVQVFRAGLILGSARLADRGTGWFHGDVSDHDVDVVDIEWNLVREVNPELGELVSDMCLPLSDEPGLSCGSFAQLFGRQLSTSNSLVRGACKLLSLIWSHRSVPEEHRLAPTPDLDPEVSEIFDYESAGYSEDLGHLLDADSRLVEFRKLITSVVLGLVGPLMNAPSLNAPRSELGTEGPLVDGQLLSTLCDRETSDEESCRLVKKSFCEFSGHVYNLQSGTGLYVAQNLVVGNCRCYPEPDIESAFGSRSQSDEPDDE